MPWKLELQRLAEEGGFVTLAAEDGLGIEFSDGADVLWMIPGDVTSTLALGQDDAINAGEVFQEFLRINTLRSRCLHVIAHYLASLQIRFDRRRD